MPCMLLVSQKEKYRKKERDGGYVSNHAIKYIHSQGLCISLKKAARGYLGGQIKDWNVVRPGRAEQPPGARRREDGRSWWVKAVGGERLLNESLVCLRRNLFGPVPTPSMTG